MKNADKINAKSNPTVVAITYDLKAVLPTRYAGDSQIYYKRKLSLFYFQYMKQTVSTVTAACGMKPKETGVQQK